ncbi:hypothetical protein [Thiomicrorhabdus sp.]|uniref:hypothetical protein n=1 Tax=Thiomicrorhabdus sp. TaxID=2039724 RepID=UPI0029C885E3|nr:hypothetical protein [Thiomicrorhabdus sp.]
MSKVMTVRDVSLEQVWTCTEEKPAAWRDNVIPSERDGQPTRRAEKGHIGKLFLFTPFLQVSCDAQACDWIQMQFISAKFAAGASLQLGIKGKFVQKTTTDRQPKKNKVVIDNLLNLISFDNLTTYDNLMPYYIHTRTCARHIPTYLFLGCQVVVKSVKAAFNQGLGATTQKTFALSDLVEVVTPAGDPSQPAPLRANDRGILLGIEILGLLKKLPGWLNVRHLVSLSKI